MAKKQTDRKLVEKSDRKPETGNRFSDLQKRAAKDLRRTGWKQTDIAEVFGTTERSVREWTRGVVLEEPDEPVSAAERIDLLNKRVVDLVDKRVTELEGTDSNVDDLSAIVQLLDRLRRATPEVEEVPIARRKSVFDELNRRLKAQQ